MKDNEQIMSYHEIIRTATELFRRAAEKTARHALEEAITIAQDAADLLLIELGNENRQGGQSNA